MPKPSRSAFYFFALEYQSRGQRNNRHRMNINEAIAACYDDWKILSDEQKQPYKVLYEDWRLNYRANPEATMGSQPHIPNKKAIKQEMKNERILSERDIPCEELKIHYDRFSVERDYLAFEYLPLDIQELLSMPIYLINFQIFCKVDEEDGGQYVPAELCVLRYTLAEGAGACRHIFIKPEKVPPGYMSACLEHLKSSHEIPLKDFAAANDNYAVIYQQLESMLFPTPVPHSAVDTSIGDDRSHRRQRRLAQPCVFFPALEFEQTSRLLEWLQEKAEGVKPTKETRLVIPTSVESLIMLLAELKKQRVSRDDIHKTFENAAYSYMVEERCYYHSELGISHCAVARCYAAAKLLAAYLNQLYVPERPASTLMSGKRPLSSSMDKSGRSSVIPVNTMLNREPPPQPPPPPPPVIIRVPIVPPPISSQFSTTGTSDSIASSYRPPELKKPTPVQPMRSVMPAASTRSSSAKYPYQSEQRNGQVSDELINHPTIMKLQQQNFHRLLSSAESTTSSSIAAKQQVLPSSSSRIYSIDDDDRITSASLITSDAHRNLSKPFPNVSTPVPQDFHSGGSSSDNQRVVLHQRKQALMKAIQDINQQMEELNMQ